MINQIRRELRATGSVTLVPSSRQRSTAPVSTADVILEILGENRDRFVISTNSPAWCASCN
jgi:LPS-assembly lipoprotein